MPSPKYVVSIWWGSTIYELVDCLEQFTADRKLEEWDGDVFWLACFALRPSELRKQRHEPPQDARDTAICKAMRACYGTVSVIDPLGRSLDRVWISFEAFVSLRRSEELHVDGKGKF